MTEADWMKQVIDLAHMCGWMVAHFRTSRTASGGYSTAVAADGKGFPDLTLARNGVVMFRELKTDKGRLTDDQERWGLVLDDLWDVWRPSDFDRVKAELR